ncbi:MAG TPA: carbonic anhydrase [Acidimicrobiales bacterium]|nr:carbonic anhydrase [Acidimicrobiales bacterium]
MTDDEILTAARAYRDRFSGSSLAAAPRRQLAVVACMDARLDLFGMLGLAVGDAHILRTAGGTVTDDVIRSLVLSQRALGTRQTILVHHTDCGMQKVDDGSLLADLERETGQRPDWQPGGFSDPFADVRTSLERLAACPWLVSKSARGFVFDVATGELIEVTEGS